MAYDEALVPQVSPIHNITFGKPMCFGEHDHDPLGPQTHMRVVSIAGLAQNHSDINRAAIKKRN